MRIAQACSLAVSIPVKVPAGGVLRPKLLSPQQVIVPFVRMPQVYAVPAATAVNVPAGGLA